MNEVSKNEGYRYVPIVDGSISDINLAFRALRNEIALSNPSGELTLTLIFTSRIDADGSSLSVPKIKLSFYHYQNFEGYINAEGLEWEETKKELIRKLRRDVNLKRLSHEATQ
jgi:hypothetical protein